VTADNTDVTVTITVNIGGQIREAKASALTNVNPYDVARGLLIGLNSEVRDWTHDAERTSRWS
jgi:hypothetical protein